MRSSRPLSFQPKGFDMSGLFHAMQTEELGTVALPEETGHSYTLRQRVVLAEGIHGARATSFMQWQPALMGIYSAAAEVFPPERVEAMLAVGHFLYGGSLSRNEVLAGLGGGSRLVAASVNLLVHSSGDPADERLLEAGRIWRIDPRAVIMPPPLGLDDAQEFICLG